MNNDRALKDKFCQEISVKYVKFILCDACLKTRLFTANECLIKDFATNNLRQSHWTVACFSPIPPAQCCFAGSKKYRKKSRHHCSNIERGEAGEGFLLRVARDFWLGLYSLYMLGISMGLFQACHVIDFQKDII